MLELRFLDDKKVKQENRISKSKNYQTYFSLYVLGINKKIWS
jgi:hypothetical protein